MHVSGNLLSLSRGQYNRLSHVVKIRETSETTLAAQLKHSPIIFGPHC